MSQKVLNWRRLPTGRAGALVYIDFKVETVTPSHSGTPKGGLITGMSVTQFIDIVHRLHYLVR